MLIALAIANGILGAFWRRWLGAGLLGGWPRAVKLASMTLLSWPLWGALDWPWALAGSIGCVLFFMFGHKTEKHGVLLRYGPFGLGFWIFHRWSLTKDYTSTDPFIDGPHSMGEFFLGGTFFATLVLVAEYL